MYFLSIGAEKTYSRNSFCIWKFVPFFNFHTQLLGGLKLSLSWRTKSLFFANVVLKPMFSPRVFSTFFILLPQPHFSTKISALFFSDPQNTQILCVWSGINFRAFWASQKENLWGGGGNHPPPPPPVEISCFRCWYKSG